MTKTLKTTEARGREKAKQPQTRRVSARSKGPVRRNSRDKYDRILDAAIQLLADHGFDDINIGDIARSAHVNRTTVYNFFQSADDIFAEVTRRYVQSFRLDMLAKIPTDLPNNLFERIDRIIDLVVIGLNDQRIMARCFFSGSRYDAYIVEERFEEICAEFYRSLTADCTPVLPEKDYDPFRTMAFVHSSFFAESIRRSGFVSDTTAFHLKLASRGYLQAVILS